MCIRDRFRSWYTRTSRPSGSVVKELWPGPHCLFSGALTKTGSCDLAQDFGSRRSASAFALSIPTVSYTHLPGYRPFSDGPLQAIAQVRLEYADGSVETVGTDELWHVSPGPVTTSSIYAGEDFDARLVQPGWDTSGFDETKWSLAKISNGPGGKLRGFTFATAPIRVTETRCV